MSPNVTGRRRGDKRSLCGGKHTVNTTKWRSTSQAHNPGGYLRRPGQKRKQEASGRAISRCHRSGLVPRGFRHARVNHRVLDFSQEQPGRRAPRRLDGHRGGIRIPACTCVSAVRTGILRSCPALELDSVLFPVNVNAWENGGFGPLILAKAKSKGMASIPTGTLLNRFSAVHRRTLKMPLSSCSPACRREQRRKLGARIMVSLCCFDPAFQSAVTARGS
jgi:hypothetical protein